MILRCVIICVLLSLGNVALAEFRVWKNSDASMILRAELLSFDGQNVRMKGEDGKTFTLSLVELHLEDQEWLRSEHSDETPGDSAKQAQQRLQDDAPSSSGSRGQRAAAFGTLHFGDSQKTVRRKLKSSTLVHPGSGGTSFFGGTVLSGVYQTSKDLGPYACYLVFDWSAAGALEVVTLQTQPTTLDQYQTNLREAWDDMELTLHKLYGKGTSTAPMPTLDQLQPGKLLFTKSWRTPQGHTVHLGTGRLDDSVFVATRILPGEPERAE